MHSKAWNKIISKGFLIGGSLFFISAIVFSFILGGVAHKEGFFGQVLKPALETNIRIPYRYIRSVLTKPERLSLDIKYIEFQKLAYKRKQALSTGVLHSSREDFVPAKIRWNNENIKVSVRLKGDLQDHWADKSKWSFRVKTKKEKAILGMREFSLQHPKTRGFFNDWFLHKLLEHIGGFIVLRYEFVQLSVNGKDHGIYLLEEHFDNKLLTNNNFVKAPIIRIYDHLLWYGVDPKIGFTKTHLNEHYTISPIDAFNTGQINTDKVQLAYFNQAKNLLESFRLGKRNTHEIFNVKKMAQLFAVIDLRGYCHSTAYSNIRFYYNPVTSLLDPIGYDNTFIMKAMSIEGEGKEVRSSSSGMTAYRDYENEQLWYNKIFEDEDFFKNYIEQLTILSRKGFLDAFFSKVDDKYQKALDLLYRTFPGYNFKYRDTIYDNQGYIRRVLNPLEAIQPYYHSLDENMGNITIEIGNIQSLPIEIIGVSGPDGFFGKVDRKTILQPKQKLRFIRFEEVGFKLPPAYKSGPEFLQDIYVVYSILGSDKKQRAKVFPWRHLDKVEDLATIGEINLHFAAYHFFEENSDNKTITVKKGHWIIDRSIIIPEGYNFFCNEATTLDLINSARIISYSTLKFHGTQNHPVVIESSDKSGRGILVLGAAAQSTLRNVIIRDLTSPILEKSHTIESPLVFYETSVDLSQCSFENCSPGFAVSIIRSDFRLNQTDFLNCENALLAYFSNGSLTNLNILNCKKNGIEAVSSTILADDIFLKSVLGKGLESRSGSLVRIKRGLCDMNNICISVNDGSNLEVESFAFSNSKVGVMLNNKIVDTGSGGQARLSAVDFVNVNERYILDNKSLLSIEGEQMDPNATEVGKTASTN